MEFRAGSTWVVKWILVSVIADGVLTAIAMVAGAITLLRAGAVLGNTATPNEFGSAMYVAGGGLVLIGIGVLLAVMTMGCVLLYRRVGKGGRISRLALSFLLLATAPWAAAGTLGVILALRAFLPSGK